MISHENSIDNSYILRTFYRCLRWIRFFARHVLHRDTTCLTGDMSQNLLHMTCLGICLQPNTFNNIIWWKTCLYARHDCKRSPRHHFPCVLLVYLLIMLFPTHHLFACIVSKFDRPTFSTNVMFLAEAIHSLNFWLFGGYM